MSIEVVKRISITGISQYALKTEVQTASNPGFTTNVESPITNGIPDLVQVANPIGTTLYCRIRHHDIIGAGSWSNTLTLNFDQIGSGDLDDDTRNAINAALNTSLILNPSFEQDTNGDGTPDYWTVTSGTAAIDNSFSIHGTNSMELSGGSAAEIRSQAVPIAADQRYKFIIGLAADSTSVSASIGIRFLDNGGMLLATRYSVLNAQTGIPATFRPYRSTIFTVGGNASQFPSGAVYAQVAIRKENAGTLWADGVALLKVDKQSSKNQVINGSGHYWTTFAGPSSWTRVGNAAWTQSSGIKNAGSYALIAQRKDASEVRVVSQIVAYTSGSFTASVQLRRLRPVSANGNVRVRALNSGGTELAVYNGGNVSGLTSFSASSIGSTTPPVGTTQLEFSVCISAQDGAFYIDTASLNNGGEKLSNTGFETWASTVTLGGWVVMNGATLTKSTSAKVGSYAAALTRAHASLSTVHEQIRDLGQNVSTDRVSAMAYLRRLSGSGSAHIKLGALDSAGTELATTTSETTSSTSYQEVSVDGWLLPSSTQKVAIDVEIGTNGDQFAIDLVGLTFSETHEDTADPPFPVGAIIMWPLPEADIPEGFYLCDGQLVGGVFQTPDLRGRFPIGANSTYPLNEVGGDTTFEHQHTLSGTLTSTQGDGHGSIVWNDETGLPNNTTEVQSGGGATVAADDHSHLVDSNLLNAFLGHDHNTDISAGTVSNESVTFLPPYHALHFIIYVGT